MSLAHCMALLVVALFQRESAHLESHSRSNPEWAHILWRWSAPRMHCSSLVTHALRRCVINLLLTCPAESVSIRKDILVATRHILATDFRAGFFSQVKNVCRQP